MAPTTINFNDLYVFASTAEAGAYHLPLYHDTLFTYPPLLGFYFIIAGKALGAASQPFFVHAAPLEPYTVRTLITVELVTPPMLTLAKLPGMVADGLVAYQVYAISRLIGATDQKARTACLIWWLNPLSIFASSVQAGWDVIEPLTLMLTSRASSSGRWFACGCWFGIGIDAKLVVAYATSAIVAIMSRLRRISTIIPAAAIFACGAVLAIATSAVPLVSAGLLASFRESVFSRTGHPVVGGFNIWSVLALDAFSPLRAAIGNSGPLLGRIALLSQVALLVFSLLAGVRRRGADNLEFALDLNLLCMSTLVITSPFVQPTYVIWLLPFLICVQTIRGHLWQRYTLALSVVSSAYILTIRSFQGVLLPGCFFFNLCSTTEFARENFAYNNLPGYLSLYLQVDIDSLLGELGAIILIFILASTVRSLWRRTFDL